MDGWEIVLFVLAGYLAVVALARLMIARRQQLVRRYRSELAAKGHHANSTQNAEAQEPAKGKAA